MMAFIVPSKLHLIILLLFDVVNSFEACIATPSTQKPRESARFIHRYRPTESAGCANFDGAREYIHPEVPDGPQEPVQIIHPTESAEWEYIHPCTPRKSAQMIHLDSPRDWSDDTVERESIEALVHQYLHAILHDTIYTDTVALFEPESYRLLKIDFGMVYDRTSAARATSVLTFLNDPYRKYLRAGVYEVSISSDDVLYGVVKAEVEKLLLGVDNVKVIRWGLDQPISPKALRHLEQNNPSVKIYYKMPLGRFNDGLSDLWAPRRRTRYQPTTPADMEALQSIMFSRNIYSLQADIIYGSFPNQDSLRLVFEALFTCPNVKELELSITKPQLALAVVGGQPNYFDFRSNPNVKLPALEVLKLSGYNLDSTSYADWELLGKEDLSEDDEDENEESQSVWAGAQNAMLRPAKSRSTNLKEWLRAMDWSQLHTLHLSQPSSSTLRALKGATPKLQHIAFVGGNANDRSALMNFVFNNKLSLSTLSLTGLRLNSLDKLVEGIINQHQTSMKHLTIHGRHKSQNTPLLLNSTTISELLSQCSKLETLNISMASTTEWDYPLLKTLASHPHLRSLTLRLEAEDQKTQPEESGEWSGPYRVTYATPSGPDEYATLVSDTSAPGLFRYLRKQKVGTPLEELDLVVFPAREEKSVYWKWPNEGWVMRYSCSVNKSGLESCRTQPERIRY